MDSNSRLADSSFAQRDDAWWEATKLGAHDYRVRLGGPFHGAWLGGLSKRLAAEQVSIDHTHARLTGNQIWIAELHLIALPGAPDLLDLDYVELAEAADSAAGTRFELMSSRLIQSRDYGGTLMLTLEAKDSLGLLGAVLGSLAQLGLFPVELHIETRDGRAYDSLWLAASEGTPPTPAMFDAAQTLLDASPTRG